MIGAGAVAALAVIGSGLVRFPDPAAADAAAAATQTKTALAKSVTRAPAMGKRPVKYVRLKPGQQAPKGARVIHEAAPTPRIIIRRVAPAPQVSSVRVVTRTRQSG